VTLATSADTLRRKRDKDVLRREAYARYWQSRGMEDPTYSEQFLRVAAREMLTQTQEDE